MRLTNPIGYFVGLGASNVVIRWFSEKHSGMVPLAIVIAGKKKKRLMAEAALSQVGLSDKIEQLRRIHFSLTKTNSTLPAMFRGCVFIRQPAFASLTP